MNIFDFKIGRSFFRISDTDACWNLFFIEKKVISGSMKILSHKIVQISWSRQKSCVQVQIFWEKSSRPMTSVGVSRCPACVLIISASCLKNTPFGRSLQNMEKDSAIDDVTRVGPRFQLGCWTKKTAWILEKQEYLEHAFHEFVEVSDK